MSRSITARAKGVLLTIREIFSAVLKKRHRRFIVLLPFLMIIAMVLAVITSSGVLAPFVYPLF